MSETALRDPENQCEPTTMDNANSSEADNAENTDKSHINEPENNLTDDTQPVPSKDISVDSPYNKEKEVTIEAASNVATHTSDDSTITTVASSHNSLAIPADQDMDIEEPIEAHEKTDEISKSADTQRTTEVFNEIENVCSNLSAQDAEEAYTACMDEITALCESKEVDFNKKDKNNITTDSARKKSVPKSEPGSSGKSDKTNASSQSSASTCHPSLIDIEAHKRKTINIYTENPGPQWYETHDNMQNISRNIIPTKLPEAFNFLPIFGRPKTKADLEEYQDNKIREFVGSGLNDEEFSNLAQYCSSDHLKTGKELVMGTTFPSVGLTEETTQFNAELEDGDKEYELCVVKKHKLRTEKDAANFFAKKLKYRGIRLMPTAQEEDTSVSRPGSPLQPGKDLIFHIRIYRPFVYSKFKYYRGRHSIFSRDLIMTGRQTLAELRDRFVCSNDIDMRVDVSDRIDEPPLASAKDLFPSGFLFINNVFYVDQRVGCSDTSQVIREWAAGKRGLGVFPHRDMGSVRLDELVIRLGHPEVYVHQGDCEHLFTFSEIRLLNLSDPLKLSTYPCHTAISQNQTVYCTTCAEFGAKWIITGCNKVPFDPAYFCDTCLKLYLYEDHKKICDFKAHSFRGNEINVLKPQG